MDPVNTPTTDVTSRTPFETEPRGFRDLYWCYLLNEPGIIFFPSPDRKMTCGACESEMAGLEGQHRFMAHIRKPTQPDQVG